MKIDKLSSNKGQGEKGLCCGSEFMKYRVQDRIRKKKSAWEGLEVTMRTKGWFTGIMRNRTCNHHLLTIKFKNWESFKWWQGHVTLNLLNMSDQGEWTYWTVVSKWPFWSEINVTVTLISMLSLSSGTNTSFLACYKYILSSLWGI